MVSAEGSDRSANDWAIELSRAGLAAMLLVGFVDFVLGSDGDPKFSSAIRLLQAATIGLIGLILALTWHSVYRRYWRTFNCAVCGVVVASEAAVGIYRGDTITLVVAAILLLAGLAALVQWGPWREIVAVSARDRGTESDLIAARDGAEAASRAKSDFLSLMSHARRFASPMNAILWAWPNCSTIPNSVRSSASISAS